MMIQEFDLFDGIDDAIVEDLVAAMESEAYQAGQIVFHEGDAAGCFFILASGAAQLFMGGGAQGASLTLKPAKPLAGPAWSAGSIMPLRFHAPSHVGSIESTKTTWIACCGNIRSPACCFTSGWPD